MLRLIESLEAEILHLMEKKLVKNKLSLKLAWCHVQLLH